MLTSLQLHLASVFLKIFLRNRQAILFSLFFPLIFIGAFSLQWIIGLIIDLGIGLNFSEINSFKFAMIFVLLTSLSSYFYFLVKNK